jgi:hypothetical protein
MKPTYTFEIYVKAVHEDTIPKEHHTLLMSCNLINLKEENVRLVTSELVSSVSKHTKLPVDNLITQLKRTEVI